MKFWTLVATMEPEYLDRRNPTLIEIKKERKNVGAVESIKVIKTVANILSTMA